MILDTLQDEFTGQCIDNVQWPHGPLGIPPSCTKTIKAFNFRRNRSNGVGPQIRLLTKTAARDPKSTS